ncbi:MULTISPECIES: GIY-YIG nuclease family protein [Ferrimonas]|uniref:GIY-YIG nuclease family protein n=1 Tax=Ferrimonas TaxID=44011 RepID=UPI0004274301|nr:MULTISPECIES: GIY-YIG nuclease family protein [Ferrimonas]USD36083.1 GIY-YIG nuclease family protein [Ferrimonas sp. SCSIO 43195]
MSLWSLYLVRTRSGSLYTGITTDVPRRFNQHQNGTGAKALRGKGPLTLAFHTEVGNRSEASKLEYKIKQLSKPCKERLIQTGVLPEPLLASPPSSEDD